MNQAKPLLTISYRLNAAELFVSSIENSNYYFFVGNHLDANSVPEPYDNAQDTILRAYYGMIFGKKIQNNDIKLMIRRINWESNTVYTAYDHTINALYDEDFYVIVQDGTQFDVFKCLENGGGSPSTEQPSRDLVSEDGEDFYFPTDGYRWKYMYSISESVAAKFSTDDYFPVEVDEGVLANALDGAIEVIAVDSPGKGYSNFISGTFQISDIRLNGDHKIYGISTPGASAANGFYDGCWLYISDGAGAGQYRKIESYTSNNTHNFVEINEAFNPSDPPQNGSLFEINPSVNIEGDGYEIVDAKARAIIDEAAGNTVVRIEMLNRGVGYNLASANVVISPPVGITSEAVLKPIYSPTGGHGSNPPLELGGKYVGLSIKLIGNESGTVITGNDYSQIGLLKDPKFKKVTLGLEDLNQDFSTNEIVYKIAPVQLHGTANTTLNGNNELTTLLTINDVVGGKVASVGDQIVLNYANNYMIANVQSVTNTTITMDKAALFETVDSSANIHLAGVSAVGLVDGFSSGFVTLTNFSGEIQSGDEIIGAETGTHGVVANVAITDSTKGFSTFIGCHTYIGSITRGAFIEDELVYQIGDAVSTAKFHSIAPDANTGTTRFYMTNQIGIFNTTGDDNFTISEIVGQSSGAEADLTNKYLPDLVFGSGEIVYIENGEAITRAEEETETFKLVLGF